MEPGPDTRCEGSAIVPPLHRAIRLLAGGEPRAALQAASEACRAAPAQPEAHYVHGQALAALGHHGAAERAFAAALQRAPGWADAWVNYGIVRYRQGSIEDGKTAMRQALRFAPDHAGAMANLAAFLRLTGQSEAAEGLLRRVLARDGANVAARLNLAADLLQQERGGEALAVLEAAPPPADRDAARHHHLALALAYLQGGGIAAARTALAACAALGPIPAALAPLWHWRHVLLASADGRRLRARRAANAMDQALEVMGPDAVPEHRIMAHFDLAKFWSHEQEHHRAFGHWVRGHDLLSESQPFSRPAHRAMVDAQVAHFTAQRFATGARASNRDPAPVFIVGMPRSGTTLCERIIAAHPRAHGAGERGALGDMAERLGGIDAAAAPGCLAGLDGQTLDEAAATYLADLHALAPGKARIVDKMPGNYLHLGLVGLLFPGARIIHCVRDPRDIGLSIFTFRFHGLHPYAHDLADLGWTIAEQDRLMTHWKAVLPNPILTVRLSDWVEDFDGTLARVLAHLDLPHDPACLRFYEGDGDVRTVSRAQVRQPVNARGLGRWTTYAAELAPLIAELDAAGLLADRNADPAAAPSPSELSAHPAHSIDASQGTQP